MAALTGCAPRAQFLAPLPSVAVTPVNVIVATNRPDLNTTDRDIALRFSELTIGVPDLRATGDVPSVGPGAFRLLDQRSLATTSELARTLGATQGYPLVIWVHGFNNTPAEAVFRQAQMAHDAGLRGPQISFVWPSAASPGGYLYDRDSALQARPSLEQLFELIPTLWSGETVVVAHSLGCSLVMETLARMRLKGQPTRLEGLVLMQPDIAPDVFDALVRDITPLPESATLVIAQDDPALRISALFSGSNERVGMTGDPADYRAMGFQVIDLTNQQDALIPHLAALTSPTVLDRIRQIANP